MLSFIVAPFITSLAQILFYGLTSIQVGITFSALMFYIFTQDEQILTDSLTGLNNRRGLDAYLTDRTTRHSNEEFTILMLDINGFKMVNDRYGHIVGDRVLIHAAKIMKNACADTKTRFFLCRYGGDEFLICGEKCTKKEQVDLIKRINTGFSEATDDPYILSVSIGISSGVCTDFQSAEALIRLADENMYEQKKLNAK